MTALVNPDDPTEYMLAMVPIMAAGTTVATSSMVVEKGLNTETQPFPAMIINCPSSVEVIVAIAGLYQSTYSVKCAYMDRWENSARTLEQCLADAKTALYQMKRNIRATPDLGLTQNGSGQICQANNHMEIHVDQATQDIGLGFPVVTGLLTVEILSPYYR